MKKLALIIIATAALHSTAYATFEISADRPNYIQDNTSANKETRDAVKALLAATKENQQLLNQLNLSLQSTNNSLEKLINSLNTVEISLNTQLIEQKKLYKLESDLAAFQKAVAKKIIQAASDEESEDDEESTPTKASE